MEYIKPMWEEYLATSPGLDKRTQDELRYAFYAGAVAHDAILREHATRGLSDLVAARAGLDEEFGKFVEELKTRIETMPAKPN